MPDELVGELDPFVLRDVGDVVLFDFGGLGVTGEIEAAGEAHDVGVDDDAGSDAVGAAEDHVGGFSGDAWEGEDLLHGARDFAAKFFDDGFAGAHDRFGFVAEEAGGAEVLFEFVGSGVGEGFRRWIFFVKRGGDLVDTRTSVVWAESDGGDEEVGRAIRGLGFAGGVRGRLGRGRRGWPGRGGGRCRGRILCRWGVFGI